MIQFKKVTKSFHSKLVLNDISFEIEKNTCCAIIGKNGAGKSTLLNLIFQLISPDSGEIIVNGDAFPTKLRPLRKEIGYAANPNFLIEEFTAFEYLSFLTRL